MRLSSLTFVISFIVAFLAIQRPAFAYLDAGTGSIILQGIIATAVGGMVMVRLYWARISSLFSSKASPDGLDSSADTDADQDSRK